MSETPSAPGAAMNAEEDDALFEAMAAQALERAADALTDIRRYLPYLAELADSVSVEARSDVPTAAVRIDGSVFVGPSWFAALSRQEALFVMAHELWHLVLRTSERLGQDADGDAAQMMNIAHDYVINDILSHELGVDVPANGLVWKDARHLSAEQIILKLREMSELPEQAWDDGAMGLPGTALGALGEAMAKAAGLEAPRRRRRGFRRDALGANDLRGRARSRRLAPRQRGSREMRAVGRRALDRAALDSSCAALSSGRSSPDQPGENVIMQAAQTADRVPIELAFQRGLDLLAPPQRTYARASRRQGDRRDLVLAGRQAQGKSLYLIFDTSGSMHWHLERLVGAIQNAATAAEIELINVIQSACSSEHEDPRDVDIQRIETARFHDFEIEGYSGDTPMVSAFRRYALDPDVERIGVVTDYGELFPRIRPPFDVIWFNTGGDRFRDYEPGDDPDGVYGYPGYGAEVLVEIA